MMSFRDLSPHTWPRGAEVATRGDTAKLYLLELDRTVILSDAVFIRRQKQSEERTAHLAVGCNTL